MCLARVERKKEGNEIICVIVKSEPSPPSRIPASPSSAHSVIEKTTNPTVKLPTDRLPGIAPFLPPSAHRRTVCSAMPCLSLEAFYNPEWRRRTEGGRERERKGCLFLPRSNSHFAMSVAGLPENAPDKLIIDAPALCIWTLKVMTDRNLIFLLKKARRNRDGEK